MTKAQIQKRLEKIDALFDPLIQDLEEVVGELDDYCDGKSEKWGESEAGQWWIGAKDDLNEAYSRLEDARSSVQEWQG